MCLSEKTLSHDEENASSLLASISYVSMPVNMLANRKYIFYCTNC